MMEIANRDEILDELIELLMKFDIERNHYQTDVYLYLDENNNARLETFVNVGGNSWLDDDHYTIYTDKEHYDDDIRSYVCNTDDFAYFLDIPYEDFEKEVKAYSDIEEDDDILYEDAYDYVCSKEEYYKKIDDIYINKIINEHNDEYYEKAEEILTDFETEKYFC